jgi:hypothetical protein
MQFWFEFGASEAKQLAALWFKRKPVRVNRPQALNFIYANGAVLPVGGLLQHLFVILTNISFELRLEHTGGDDQIGISLHDGNRDNFDHDS